MPKGVIKLLLIVFCVAAFQVVPVTAQIDQNNINVIVGDVENVKVSGLTRVSITDPEIADIADANDTQVSVVARKMGHTVLFVWDATGKKIYSVNVSGDDLLRLKNRINTLLDDAGINTVFLDANYTEGKVVISGNINKDQKMRMEKVLEPFSEQVINLCKEDEAQELVQIDMQITELSSTLDKNLGIVWSGSSGETDLKLLYNESTNTFVNGAKDWFKIGQFNRQNTIQNTINLMVKEGKARTLSRPRIVVTSGKEATVNVGGEVPIQTTTSNATGGSIQTNVTFKQYGLTVTVTPTIREGKVDVTMNLQISDIDTTFPVKATSTNGVAYKTRTAQTQLMLEDKQTVVMAGLIRYQDGQQQNRVPFLGKIPVVGMLFRNTSKGSPDEAKEVVITLTPVILHNKKFATQQMKIPTAEVEAFSKEVEEKNKYKNEPIDPVQEMGAIPKETPAADLAEKTKTVVIQTNKAQESADRPISSVQKYMQDIQVKISQNISYPYEALKNKWQGEVKLKLHILKDGTLVDALVVTSSGKKAFDDDALNAAKIAAPYAPFSKDMESAELNVTIPIVYQAK